MKLNDIIKSYNWLSVELTLLRLYPDQETMVDDYRNVFEKLKFLEPEEYDMSIVLTENDYDSDDESEARTYVDVSGRKKEKDLNSMTDSYAIEFVEWEKWLGKVNATTVNRTDCGFRSAVYFISRFFSGLFRPKFKTPGNEFAGVIETIDKNVTSFNIGDKVFGFSGIKFGAHAEYLKFLYHHSSTNSKT